MRVAQQMPVNQFNNNRQLTNIKSSQGKTYSLGQKLTAIVLNIMDSLTTIDIEGDVVTAKNISDRGLFAGQQIRVEVAGQEDGSMLLKLIEGDASKSNALVAQLTDELRDLNMPFNDKNILTLKTMHEQGARVNAETFIKMQQSTASLEQLVKNLIQNDGQAINWHQSAKENLLLDQVVDSQQAPSEGGDAENKSTMAETSSQSEAFDMDGKSSELKEEGLALKSEIAGKEASKLSETGAKIEVKDNLNNKQLADNFEFKNLDLKMKNMLFELVNNNPKKLTQTLAFMQKNNVPNSLLNTLLSSEVMGGKLSLLSSVLEIIDDAGDNAPKEMTEIANKLNSLSLKLTDMPEKLDGAVLKELIETANSLQKVLAENEGKSENGTRAEHLVVAKDVQSLLVDSPIPWQNIQLPLQMQRELEDIDIYIKGDARKGGKFNPDDGMIYIALNTNKMERVKVKLNFKSEQIKINFICDSSQISQFMALHSEQMLEKISNLSDKQILLDFTADDKALNLADLEKVDLAKMTVFDVKI